MVRIRIQTRNVEYSGLVREVGQQQSEPEPWGAARRAQAHSHMQFLGLNRYYIVTVTGYLFMSIIRYEIWYKFV